MLQWADHDEENAFFRATTIKDWPLLKLRTVIPTPDHRNTILPTRNPAWNYYAIMDGLARFRFNGLVDWTPSAICGSEAWTRQLHDYTAKLPLVHKDWNFPVIGYDTKTNLQSGAIVGITFEIDGCIDFYQNKYDNFNVVLTGGDAGYFARHLKNKIFADLKFLFKGLYAISEVNNC